jgi:hypothetical protein
MKAQRAIGEAVHLHSVSKPKAIKQQWISDDLDIPMLTGVGDRVPQCIAWFEDSILDFESTSLQSSRSQILHHCQERAALLAMVRVSAAQRAAETRLMRKVQDVSDSKYIELM